MRKIVLFPNNILRSRAKEIVAIDKKLLGEIEDLKKILNASENGAGIAAPQIGVAKRFLGLKNQNGVEVLINPKITKTFGEKVYPMIVENKGEESDFLEGCLSFPDLWGTVKRYLKIEIQWEKIIEEKLEMRNEILEGFEAIVFQHEFDHLEGILFVDRIKEEGGKFFYWKDKDKEIVDVDEILKKEK